MKQLVAYEVARLHKKSLDDNHRPLYHNTQSKICSILYNVVEHVMLDLLLNDIIDDTLHGYKMKLFDMDADAVRG